MRRPQKPPSPAGRPRTRRTDRELLTKQNMLTHGAPRIAANIAKLPELLGRSAQPMVGLMPNEPEALDRVGQVLGQD
jgi:hypothetical protein